MAEFKIVIGDPKTGKCYQRTLGENALKQFIGLKIGDSIKGEAIDLAGYEFLITGGSDFCGFPMRKGIIGMRKKILAKGGVGFKKYKGIKIRKTVCGETINEKISQINLKIVKYGATPLALPETKKEGEAPKEELKAEKKAEEKPKKGAKLEEKEEPKEKKKSKEEKVEK